MNKLNSEEQYHNAVANFYRERSNNDFTWEIPEELFLLKKQYFTPKSKVVDMGCGPSISIRRILGDSIIKTIIYIGVDISTNMLKIARNNIKQGVFIHANMETVKIPHQSVDVIISLGALHHTTNKSKTLEHWYKLLKYNGYLLMREPLYEFLKRGHGESPLEEGVDRHELINFINKHNMHIVKITYFNTNAFHLFNRIMIKIGLGNWKAIRIFWYPLVIIDSILSKISQPQAIAIIIRK